MSLTVRTLLLNHSRGIHNNIKTYEGQYFGDAEIPKFDDITDMVQYKLDLKAKFQEIERQIKKEKEDLKQANIDKAREKAQKEKENEPTPPETPPEAKQ